MSRKENKKRVCVLGMGYIGLPTACFFAKAGFRVIGVDINEKRVVGLQKGKLPFQENGLPDLFRKARKNTVFTSVIEPANIFIIAVPTPLTKDKKCELSHVISAARMIASVLENGNLIVLESTVSPLTCANTLKSIFDKTGKRYFLSHCPERAIPGGTLYEMEHDDRVVGGIDLQSTKRTVDLYRSFVKGNMYETDATTAEVVKVSENTYRDVNIAFANELARICENLEVNVWEAIKLANLHPRVNIHWPGPGVGGHCIAIDPWYLTEQYPQSKIIKQARILNDSMPEFVVKKFEKEGDKRIHKVGIFGVAYKKNIDDPREAPAGYIVQLLEKKAYTVRCADPYVKNFQKKLYRQNDVLSWADAVILVTDHDLYKNINFARYPNIKLVYDTRNLYNGKIKGKAKIVTLGVTSN
jgi:UDP-N-acetyl-D-mannosaminuronic acid dehydrogenase